MSTALAIAGVSAVLRDLLNDGLSNLKVSSDLGISVTVSVQPPDRVITSDSAESNQLNLFLHQLTPNTGWSNEGLPSRDYTGRQRFANPPLALNLHYLLSAYGEAELHGELLLGCGVQVLHETPILSREAIRSALTPSQQPATALQQALADTGLADQIEQIKITPQYLSTEEMSKLWTATQARYRPTAAYQVSVVLMESTQPTSAPLPVLTRGARDPATQRERGVVVQPGLVPPLPVIEAVNPSGGQPVVRLGEAVELVGHHLDGTDPEVRLVNERFAIDETLPADNANYEGTHLKFVIPIDRAADFPVGIYEVSARVRSPGKTDPRSTNRLALVIAPEITNLPMSVARDGAGAASFTLQFHPELRASQSVSLLLGQEAFAPVDGTAPVAELDFVIPDATVGSHLARLRIDGIDSPIIDRTTTPPEFLDCRIEIEP